MSARIFKQPWILVILAFVALILAWIVTFQLSKDVDTHRLSGDEESRVLELREKVMQDQTKKAPGS